MPRNITVRVFAVFCLIASIGFAVEKRGAISGATTPVSSPSGSNKGDIDGADDQGFRLREGMKFVNKIGVLKDVGQRIAFEPEGQTGDLLLLENLALERVSGDLDHTGRKWSVTGVVTEYKGTNYLLLHRAVLKARSTKKSGPRS